MSKLRLLLTTCPLVTSPVDCVLHLPVMLSLSAGSPEDVPGAAADHAWGCSSSTVPRWHNVGHGRGGQARTERDGDSSNQLFSERVT